MDLRRGCSPALLKILAGHFHPVILIEGEWHDGPFALHMGSGNLEWDGRTWIGVGVGVTDRLNLVDFTGPADGDGMTADGGVIRVAATLEAVMAERGKLIRNRPITVWFGAVTDSEATALDADPVVLFTGYFDERSFDFQRSGEEYSHDLTLGLGLGPAPRARASVRHSAEDQEREYPGDTAGRHLVNAEKRRLNPPSWPEP